MSKEIKPRLKFFINKKFQLQFLLFVLAPILLSAVAMFICKELMYQEKVAMGQRMGLPAEHGYFELLKYHQSIENQMIIIAFAVTALIFVVWSLLVSHRIAGPIYRFTETLKAAKPNEKLKPIQFRPNDFFQEIPQTFNEFLKSHDLEKKD